jgi:hypothetical protein
MAVTAERDETFLTASAGLVVAGAVLATITPVVGGAPTAFVGSIVTSGLLGLVFTVRNLRVFRATAAVGLPAATLSMIFGVWFMIAPLLYDVGFVATAGTQFAGLLVASFATYMLVHGLTASTSGG